MIAPKLATRTLHLALAALTAAAATGCYTSYIKSGAPVAAAPIEHDEKWHSGIIYGLAELSGPYDLSRICPNGWAEIKTETSFVNGLVEWVTFSLYNPQTVTVRCAAGGVPVAAPPMSVPPAVPAPGPVPGPPPAPPPPP